MEHLKFRLRFDEPGGTLPLRRRRCWNGVSAETVSITSSDPFEFALQGSPHYVALHDIVSADHEIKITGLSPSHRRDIRGTMTFVPSGCEAVGWQAPVKRKNSFTAIYLDPAVLLVDSAEVNTLEPMLYFENLALSSTVEKFRAIIDDACPNSAYAETLGLMLMMEICNFSQSISKRPPRCHGLAPAVESKVREYIDANLSRDISLTELAEIAGLSRFHFARSFKRSTGLPPHQYLLRKRIERAKELLSLRKRPISEIAGAVGFNSPVSLARMFRRLTGTPLKEFERKA
ncbi:MAG TPA: AraC family transcriptional regulator [Methyloceanibacter sp.]|nr:AraC family transcriptional regulator [Methyloceanibacter sp.]